MSIVYENNQQIVIEIKKIDARKTNISTGNCGKIRYQTTRFNQITYKEKFRF